MNGRAKRDKFTEIANFIKSKTLSLNFVKFHKNHLYSKATKIVSLEFRQKRTFEKFICYFLHLDSLSCHGKAAATASLDFRQIHSRQKRYTPL